MSRNFAYCRVSTTLQTTENQAQEIMRPNRDRPAASFRKRYRAASPRWSTKASRSQWIGSDPAMS
jgi:hypothetical protein